MPTRRLSPRERQEDLDAYAALQAMTGYNPSNAAFSVANVTAAYEAMQESQTGEVQAQAAADAARDKATGDEWEFHDVILGVKAQVKAQFGENSDQLQSLGLKKKSEYKKPSRTTEPETPTP
jgi:hypothetical protein